MKVNLSENQKKNFDSYIEMQFRVGLIKNDVSDVEKVYCILEVDQCHYRNNFKCGRCDKD